ncbi:MAG: hypothetical protein ACR2IF_06150 [Terriglobales bacterium]
MLSVRMRMDIHPRCDRHPESIMVPVMMQMKPGPAHPWTPAFVCGEPNCPRHYNVADGYFNIFKQRTDPDANRRVPCPNESFPMYLADYEPHSKVWTWRCAQFGCDGLTVEVGATAHIRGQHAWGGR